MPANQVLPPGYEKAIPITYKERADFYEVEYSTTIDQEFLRQLITPDVTSILEIPSGVGRNAVWLAQNDCFIVEADLEFRMVKRLQERLRALRLNDRVHPIVADMRSLCFSDQFDLIIVPQGGFQLVADEKGSRMALNSLRRCLRSTGTLIIDLAIFDSTNPGDKSVCPSYYDPSVPDGELISEWEKQLPNGGIISRSRIQKHENDTIQVCFFYKLIDNINNEKIMTYRMTSRIFTYSAFVSLATESYLKPKAVYRNYEGESYDRESEKHSSRMIFLLERMH